MVGHPQASIVTSLRGMDGESVECSVAFAASNHQTDSDIGSYKAQDRIGLSRFVRIANDTPLCTIATGARLHGWHCTIADNQLWCKLINTHWYACRCLPDHDLIRSLAHLTVGVFMTKFAYEKMNEFPSTSQRPMQNNKRRVLMFEVYGSCWWLNK